MQCNILVWNLKYIEFDAMTLIIISAQVGVTKTNAEKCYTCVKELL